MEAVDMKSMQVSSSTKDRLRIIRGVQQVLDFGEFWGRRRGLPLPLG